MHFVATGELPDDFDMAQLLVSSVKDELGNVVWENTCPGGCQYLRPVDIRHFPENAKTVKEVFELLYSVNGDVLTISADQVTIRLIVSGIDGKVRNYLLDNKSRTSCPICMRANTKLGAGSYDEQNEAGQIHRSRRCGDARSENIQPLDLEAAQPVTHGQRLPATR